MTEAASLIERAKKYLKSARTLLEEKDYESSVSRRQLGDYEYTFVISPEEAQELLQKSESFVSEVVQYLRTNGVL